MRKRTTCSLYVALAACGLLVWCAPVARADFAYDESVDGDLPHPNSAYVLPFGTPNPNSIRFTVDLGSDGWILQVDPGETLRTFTLTSFIPNDPEYTATFHMHDGPSESDPVLGIEYASFGTELRGTDFLEHFGIPPLGPGQYLFGFWHDNTPDPTVKFYFDITGTSPVEGRTWGIIKTLYR